MLAIVNMLSEDIFITHIPKTSDLFLGTPRDIINIYFAIKTYGYDNEKKPTERDACVSVIYNCHSYIEH